MVNIKHLVDFLKKLTGSMADEMGEPEAIKLATLLVSQPCILCGASSPESYGAFLPGSPETHGFEDGDMAFLLYLICSKCEALPNYKECLSTMFDENAAKTAAKDFYEEKQGPSSSGKRTLH